MTTDPKQLQPADVPALGGDKLNRAVEWWVYGDDLTLDSPVQHDSPPSDPHRRFRCAYYSLDSITGQEWGGPIVPQAEWRPEVAAEMAAFRAQPRPFTTDANLVLAFWEPGGVLAVANIEVRFPNATSPLYEAGEFDGGWIPLLVDQETFQLAACRAAVLEKMRSGR